MAVADRASTPPGPGQRGEQLPGGGAQPPPGPPGPPAPSAPTATRPSPVRWDVTWRLFALSKGVRGRVAFAAALGVGITVAGVARLTMQGTAVALVFEGAPFSQVLLVLLSVLCLPFLRIVLTMAKEFTSQGTAALMKVKLRRMLYAHLLTLGPA
ncbi:MAG TPA: hypothetical protein VH257_10750, partial [Chloroflexota bacterium]|nr:hypothetical protein [Chloroflexota bacterium]